MTAVPKDVTISAPLYGHEKRLSANTAAEARRRLEKMRELNKTRILTLPFRQASYLTWRAYRGLKDIMSPNQFIYLHVKGKNGVWKIDQTAAWALDEGKAIDKLVKHTL